MDAVVAGNILSQVLPDFHGVDQSVALFLGGHVHTGGGTAADSAAGTGFKIIGSMAQCIHQVQMGVSVDKAGEHNTTGNINDIATGEVLTDFNNFIAFHGQISHLQAFGSNQCAVFQDRHNYSHLPDSDILEYLKSRIAAGVPGQKLSLIIFL